MDETDQTTPEVETRSTSVARLPRRRRDLSAPIRRRSIRPLPEFTGLAIPGEDEAGSEFLPAAQQIVATPMASSKRIAAYVLCGTVLLAIVWSIFGTLRLFVSAAGEFEARGGSQVVEPLEAGQVTTIAVKDGDHVERGAAVLQLDPTAARATVTIVEAGLANVRAEALRRRAAVAAARLPQIDAKATIGWPSKIAIPAETKAREQSVLRADLTQLAATVDGLQAELKAETALRDKYVANIAAQKTLVDSRSRRTAMHEKLAELGRDSRALVLESQEPLRQDQVSLAEYEGALEEADKTLAVIESQIASARSAFVDDNTDKAAVAERQVADFAETLKKAKLTLANTTLRAPVSGIVQSLAVTSTGQAVKVGEQLMQIVPDGAPLEIQAYVLNTDIGFLKVGQPATIKVDTFPFTRYGTIAGRVTYVGADAITGAYAMLQQKNGATTPSKGVLSVTNPAQQMSDLVFPVTVVPDRTTIDVDGRQVKLTPGMSMVAEIQIDRQRAISYVLYPWTRVFSAR